MKLEGIHHITAITGDAPQNVRFYVGTLGLRLVKKCINQDDPTVYHLFYADEEGDPGSDITFFEYPNAAPGRVGAGMVHLIGWRVSGEEALDFWEKRLASHEVETTRNDGTLRFKDPEGLAHELRVADTDDESLVARFPGIPEEYALQGFDGARAYAADPSASADFLRATLEFEGEPDSEWTVRGKRRGSFYAYDEPPPEAGIQGAGSVHHIAWACGMDEHQKWHERMTGAGAKPTPIIYRWYFKSIYFREPSGVLFEIATLGGPGFKVDESVEHLGEKLSLPPDYEHLRDKLEGILTPLPDPRAEAEADAAKET
jgi:glyoxalase family protein